MSLLNFIAGGFVANTKPSYQVRPDPIIQSRSALGNGLCMYVSPPSSSTTSSYISSSSTTQQIQAPQMQPNVISQDSFFREYYFMVNRFNTQETRDPILHSLNSYFANPFARPSTIISSRNFEYETLLQKDKFIII